MRGVHLHAQEIVASGGVEEDVLGVVSPALELGLAALEGLVVGHGQGQAHGHPRRGTPDGLDGDPVPGDQVLRHRPGLVLVRLAGWEHAGHPAHDRHHVGLVDGAGPGHDVAQCAGHHLAEATEALDGGPALPPTLIGEPPRGREVVEGDHRIDRPGHAARRTAPGSAPAPPGRTPPLPARCGSIRPRSGSCPGRETPPVRRPPATGPTSRTRPRRARRTPCRARARTPTSRYWRCRPLSGGRPWPCPR